MRSQRRQRQWVWFAKPTMQRVGLDNVMVYSEFEKHFVTVSPTTGYPLLLSSGFIPTYDRYITSFEKTWKPTEGTVAWVDIEPEVDVNGNVVIDSKTKNPTVLPDHIIDKLMWTKKAKMDRYGLKKLGASNGD